MPESKDVVRAMDILRGRDETPAEMLKLAKRLQKETRFGLARKLVKRARETPVSDPKLRTALRQKHALYTYKDPDLPTQRKLRDALAILEQDEDLETTCDQETLGLVGAIHKRMWEHDTQKGHLERSLAYYLRGYRVGPRTDYGYTSINAAYVLDLLASLEEEQQVGAPSATAGPRRQQAEQIRRELLATLPGMEQQETWLATEWWFYATLAEARFGLGQYDEACATIRDGLEKVGELPDWELESTARQLASLARLRARPGEELKKGSPAWRVLEVLLGGNAAAVRTSFSGKLGLGLSGGGFRASLFHIGVLARLAELDLLRHVHVLSCVSGGSILGAYYYLEVRKLLREKPDAEITAQDYADIVSRMVDDFTAGVERNIRTRVAGNPLVNLRMLFSSTYSRTQRAGELFESELYARVKDGEGGRERYINDLYIHPAGEPEDFNPKVNNWRRRNKVPMLVLNATALNTGHAWQFTASWMGESPFLIDTDTDGNKRLRRMYYREAPERHRKVRLGTAVGASACVPGLFEPVAFEGLYPDMTVRLVDGGVHDNQGIASLLEQDCNVVLVSDASGQMNTDPRPKGGVLGPALRSNSVLMERVRQSQFQDLKGRLDGSLLKGLMVVHLKQDLDVETVDWVRCEEPKEDAQRQQRPLTTYGIRKDVQELLAGVRTDLDSFSEAEAYALMTSGYRMVEKYVEGIRGFPAPETPPAVTWRFLEIEPPMKQIAGVDRQHERLMKLLRVSGTKAFRIWKLSRALKLVAGALGLGAVAALAWALWNWWQETLFQVTVAGIGMFLFWVVLAAVVGKSVVAVARWRQTLTRVAIGVGMGLVGWIAAQLHLRVFDRWFLKLGRAKRVMS